MNRRILGVDLGNVIRPAVPNGQHGSFDLSDESFLYSPDFPGALPCLLKAREHFDEIHLVSRIIEGRDHDRNRWLTHRGYDEVFDERHYCREYEDKAAICERLGVTHFVDDQLFKVLSRLTMVKKLFWFRAILEPSDLDHLHLLRERRIRVAASWPRLRPQLIGL